ncbi:ABC transporter permease [Paenibacillus sedimenti]|uniref:ABC transporter permease n=1 Tax=Paenibacillus sedimenti TaxID=2770274 RepID=A0A926QHN9_9BACL|nr:ABC transporter permease [Paenibacillus sedimenti]MBD0378718.1 ABC transporter permease [Paenibacillus sedimenti]
MSAGAEALVTKKHNVGLSMKKIWNQLGMLIVLVVICIILAIFAPNFTDTGNILNILKQSSVNGILAAGMTLVILTGGIDLSVGSTIALAGVVSVLLSKQGVNPVIAMFAGIAVGYLAGWINGFLTARTKLPSFIVTLGSMTYIRGAAYVISGGLPTILASEPFKFIGSGKILSVPTPIYIMLSVYIVMFIVLKYTMFGRHIYAIGGNEEAARLTGIKVEKTLIHVYAISGLCAGLAGVVLAGRLISGQPNAGSMAELDAIAAVVLGGTSLAGGIGRIQMTIIGVLILGVIRNGLTLLNVSFFWQTVITGIVIVLAVLLDRLRSDK